MESELGDYIRGGGGLHSFYFIRWLGHIIYCLPKNIWNIRHTQKIFEIIATQNISIFASSLTSRKGHKNAQKWPLQPVQIFFSVNTQKYWNSRFKPPKMVKAYVCVKISEYPLPRMMVLFVFVNWLLFPILFCGGFLFGPLFTLQ